MRVAVTGAAGRLGRHLVAALADAPFTGPAGPIAWDRDAFDLDAPERDRRAPRPRPAGGRRPRRGLDRRRRLRPRPGARPATQRGRDGRSRRRPARSAGSTSSSSRPTRSSTGTRLDGDGYLPTDPVVAGQPVRRIEGGGRAPRRGRLRRPTGGRTRDRPDGLAVRGTRAATTRAEILEAAERARAAGEPLRLVSDEWGTPTYTADVADAIVGLLAEDATAGVHHLVNGLVRDPWRLGPLRRRPGGHRGRHRQRPVLHLGAPVAAAALGRPGPDATPRRPDAVVAGRHGRLRAGPPAHDAGPGMTPDDAPATGPSGSILPGRQLRIDRPPRRRPRLVPRAVAGGPVPGRDLRPGQPVHLGRRGPPRAPSPPTPGRPVDRRGRPGAGRARRRPAGAGRHGSGGRGDPRAGGRRLGLDPDRGRPRVPRDRAAPAGLSGHQRVRRLGRARLRLGRPGGRGSLAGRSRRRPTDARSSPSGMLTNPPLADLVVRLRHDPL